ncbi:MAG: MFS transporter [Eubacterium sp.]|nr:MFS transporter [Eubacterium sp.]
MVFRPDRLLGSKVFDTRIKSANVQTSERLLGFLLGPAFVMSMFYISGQSYLNMFYTDVLKLTPVWGGLFLTLLPVLSKIVDAITNLYMGWIIDHTKSRHGKARPWLLLSGPLLAVSSILLFSVPKASTAVQVIWVTVSYNLYFSIAFTMYNISHNLMVPLSTRNSKQRDGLAVLASMGISLLPGIVVSFIFPTFVLPAIGIDQGKWMLVMSVLSILALPAVMLEYYFTRERVTEETDGQSEELLTVSTRDQLKGCLKSKYWISIMLIMMVFQLYNNLQATSIIYYSNWVLGTYNDGVTLTMLNVIGQGPLGTGALVMLPLVKKLGKRNTMIGGFVIGIVGCVLALTNVKSMGIVLVGLVLKSIGTIPITYVLIGMLADALDHVEWINGFRCDGFSTSIQSIIITIMSGLSAGLFNLGLSATGYVAPEGTAEQIAAMTQTAGAQNFFSWGVFLFPAIGFAIMLLILLPYKLDKDLPQMQKDIIARHKAEAEARGEVYVSPEEKARLEQEELDRIAEEKRIAELKEHCRRKGLSFEAEEAKYQARLAEKKAKAEAKAKKTGR